jgi:hypothetical protein
VVADGDVVDPFAQLLDHAGGLDQRGRQRDGSVRCREVAAADAAGRDLHHHLAAVGRLDLDLFHTQRIVPLANDDGLSDLTHVATSPDAPRTSSRGGSRTRVYGSVDSSVKPTPQTKRARWW